MSIKRVHFIADLILNIIILVAISFIYYISLHVESKKVLYVPSGSVASTIKYLQTNGYDVSKIDAKLLRFLGHPQKGWINIGETKLTRLDFLYRLTKAKAATKPIMLIPGETTVIFLEGVAQNFGLDARKLQKLYLQYAPIKEGVLFPETYNLPLGADEEQIVKLLLHNSMKRHKRLSQKVFNKFDSKKWFRYITIASIIEKESGGVKEMPLVSSVIYNRLKKGMKLQMDGTLNYGRYSHVRVTAKRIRTDKSRYNTYKYKGLPPTPICTVSFDAIKAALAPKKSKYLYFVKIGKNKHKFSKTYREHIRAIKNVKN